MYLRTVLAYSLTVGCSSANAEPQVCAGAAAQPLFNGSSAETYLGLAPSEIQAIVEVVEGGRPDGALCTGAFVAPEWVVTARHCLQIPSAEVVVHDGESGRTVELPIADRIGHPTEDLALLRLDMGWSSTDVPPLEPLEPLGLADAEGPTLAVGDSVEIAGYGLTESGTDRALGFLAEPIVELDERIFTVSGNGASGACVGDSGGPLLVRGEGGRVVIAGVLSSGSASCRKDDHYVRVDALRDWIQEIAGTYVTQRPSCGTIATAGRCLYGQALWCEAGELSAERCAGGQRCGWDRAASGYRCVDSDAEPRCAAAL